jgi:hypothetical protein
VGSSQSVSVSCPNATSYVWQLTNPALQTSTLQNCTSTSCNIISGNLPSAGQYTVSVTASNIGGSSNTPTTTIMVNDVVTGGSSCVVKVADWGPGGPGEYLTVPYNKGLAVQIRGLASGTGSIANVLNNPSGTAKFMSVSTTACDFTPVSSLCARTSRSNTPIIAYGAGTGSSSTCNVPANTTLYVNVRNGKSATDADACPSGNCQVTVVY